VPGVQVALDAQLLQSVHPGDRLARERVSDYASALRRSGLLAAALLAPEQGTPDSEGPFAWNCLPEARRIAARGDVAYLVPEPFYGLSPGAPPAHLVSDHWAALGVPRVVYLPGVQPYESLSPSALERLRARMDWVACADLILSVSDAVADRASRLLGRTLADTVIIGGEADGWDALAERTAAALDRLAKQGRSSKPLRPRIAVVGPFPPYGGGIGVYNASFVAAAAGASHVDAVTTGWTRWQPHSPAGKAHIESFGHDLQPASYDAVVYTLGNSDGHLPSIEAALRYPGWLWLHETRLPAVATSALSALDDDAFWQRFSCLLERAYPGRAPVGAARSAGRDHLVLARAGVGLVQPLAAHGIGVLVNSAAARRSVLLDLVPGAWHPPVHVVPPACPPVRRRDRPPVAGADALVVALGIVSMGKRPDLLVDAVAQVGCRLAFVGPCPDVLAQLIRERAAVKGIAEKVEVTGTVQDDEWWTWMERASLAVQLREHSSGELSAALLDALAAGLPVVTNLPAAADYPDDTVVVVGDCDPASVAQPITRLLSSSPELLAYSAAGQDFAASHQMSHLAERVLSLITSAQV
jgi:glycosyltransferase involved in cell wall biosynthesis